MERRGFIMSISLGIAGLEREREKRGRKLEMQTYKLPIWDKTLGEIPVTRLSDTLSTLSHSHLCSL